MRSIVFVMVAMIGAAAARPANDELPLRAATAKRVAVFVNHWWLQVFANGTINGALVPVAFTRHRVADGTLLRDADTCYFVCFNECGHAYATRLPNAECVLIEKFDGSYTVFYRQQEHQRAYLALNVAGKIRRTLKPDSQALLVLIDKGVADTDIVCLNVNKLKHKLAHQPAKKICNRSNRSVKNDDDDDDDDDDRVYALGEKGNVEKNFYDVDTEPSVEIKLLPAPPPPPFIVSNDVCWV